VIEIVEHGAVRELRLARPPANALSPELIVALAQAVGAAAEEAEQAPRLSERPPRPERLAALVLSGAPGMFSAGLDVPYLLTRDRGGIRDMWRDFYSLLRGLAGSPLPLVAAITGHSPAGGAVLALYCDVRVMAAGDYRIGLNEVRVGLPMPPVILAAMRRLVGPRLAERLCVGGALLTAAEAERAGLVDEVVPPEQVVERAVAVAAELAALPRAAMTETRRMARADLVALFDGGTRLEDTEVESLLDSWFGDEAQTTMRALVERLARRRAGGG
jgi:Delta3-Delta2-enoyl-CoA isomerase